MRRYMYGMRLRGFSPGAQPMAGLLYAVDPSFSYRRYWSILCYDRELSEDECRQYSLDLLYSKGEEEK